jgi:hypothetical protein
LIEIQMRHAATPKTIPGKSGPMPFGYVAFLSTITRSFLDIFLKSARIHEQKATLGNLKPLAFRKEANGHRRYIYHLCFRGG